MMTLPQSVLMLVFASLLVSPAATAKFLQQGPKLVSSGVQIHSGQGFSVSTSSDGNTAIVGAPSDGDSGTGAAWVFMRNGVTWTQQGPKLVGSDATLGATLGVSVSLSGDGNTAIVGGEYDGEQDGAAWVFTRAGGVWTQQGPKLVGTGASANARQGNAVALSTDGNTAIVGASRDNQFVGAAWIFIRSGGVWTQQGGKLVGSGPAGTAAQGYAVALSADGNTAVVGGPGDGDLTGAAWFYTRSGGVWTQQGPKLIGSGAVGTAEQGLSVSLSADGNTAIVGGPQDNTLAGATWVFTRAGGAWTQQGPKLVGSGALASAFGSAGQGQSVSLSADGNTGIVGGSGDNFNAGAAWMFRRRGSVWSQLGSKLVGTGAVDAAWQGYSVAISGDGATAFLGGVSDDAGIGATWVFSSAGGLLATNLVYKPLEPCRIMDTRKATLASGVQGPIAGNSLRTLPGFVTAGQNWGQYGGSAASDCGLTSPPGPSINAVALVATVLNPNFDAYLGIGDDGDLATVLSKVALNYTANQGLSTMYIVPQIDSNQIYFAMPAGLSAQLIYDVVGYYVSADATAMQCTTQSSSAVAIGSGASGSATSPACGAGYTLTGGSCDSTSFTLNQTQNKASGGNTNWLCAATNRVGGSANLTATANCCRVSGK